MTFYLGLDLGQASDFTALAIVRRQDGPRPRSYEIPWLERFPLGTSYPAIVAAVARRCRQLATQSPLPGPAPGVRYADHPLNRAHIEQRLLVDATGVGRPVVDLLRRERLPGTLYDVTITGGDTATQQGMSWRVPKRELVSVAQVLLQSGRLKIAEALPDTAVLTRELLNFQVKISDQAHDSYGAWREGTHDDLVLAVALACWAGEQLPEVNARVF
jgi:hypothetical protein